MKIINLSKEHSLVLWRIGGLVGALRTYQPKLESAVVVTSTTNCGIFLKILNGLTDGVQFALLRKPISSCISDALKHSRLEKQSNPTVSRAMDSFRRFSSVGSRFERQRKLRSQSLASFKLSYYMPEDLENGSDGFGFCDWMLTGLAWFIVIVTFPLSFIFCIKVVQEYERAVIFRLGRLIIGGARGPGIFFVLPCIETYTKVDLRTVSFDVPPQEILTKDSVTISVDAVVYYRIYNATVSVANVENAHHATRLLAQTALRNMLGMKSLSEILSDREAIASCMRNLLDDATGRWGIIVERVEIKDVRLPVQLQRVMATEAEAAREARAKLIAAQGEQEASKALKAASEIIAASPAALQLRYLQTLATAPETWNSSRGSEKILPLFIRQQQRQSTNTPSSHH
ncbi:Stomatin-2 [Trichinella spiralis]|uniref:Stomatin-2 n=1 Tax=Trichinella spiralis TaxID=6334 RepID=A0ABR3KQM1_TRISP